MRRAAAALVVAAAVVSCGAEPTAPTTVDLGRTAEPAIVAVAPSASSPSTSAGVIAWRTDIDDARRRARSAGRPLLVFVTAEWDTNSLEVERETFADARVVRAARGAVALRLDATNVDVPYAFVEGLDVTKVPTIVVLSASERVTFRSVGRLVDVDELVDALGAP